MPKLKRYWRALQKKERQQGDEEAREKMQRDKNFVANLIQQFLQVLGTIPEKGEKSYLFVQEHRPIRKLVIACIKSRQARYMYSDCLGCAVLLCLAVCLTLLTSFFLPSLISH